MKKHVFLLTVLLTLHSCLFSQNTTNKKPNQDRFSHVLHQKNNINDLQIIDSFSIADKKINVKIINISKDTIIMKNSWVIQEPSIIRLYAINSNNLDTICYISHSYRDNESNTIIKPGEMIESNYYIGNWDIDFRKTYQLLIKHRVAYFAIQATDGTRFYIKNSNFDINKAKINRKRCQSKNRKH